MSGVRGREIEQYIFFRRPRVSSSYHRNRYIARQSSAGRASVCRGQRPSRHPRLDRALDLCSRHADTLDYRDMSHAPKLLNAEPDTHLNMYAMELSKKRERKRRYSRLAAPCRSLASRGQLRSPQIVHTHVPCPLTLPPFIMQHVRFDAPPHAMAGPLTITRTAFPSGEPSAHHRIYCSSVSTAASTALLLGSRTSATSSRVRLDVGFVARRCA